MKFNSLGLILLIAALSVSSCRNKTNQNETRIIFLHHSTGVRIWHGFPTRLSYFVNARIGKELSYLFYRKAPLPHLVKKYNKRKRKNYVVEGITFPKIAPYGWNNYPYDYYNIWVKHAGATPFMEEPTLEMLTKEYQVVIFKHCFPVSNIQANKDTSDINSDYKSIANYKLQYLSLREKLHEFPGTKFIVFTGAVQVKSQISIEEAVRAKEFNRWVINEWDQLDDNIYIWDLYTLQTKGGLYFTQEYAVSENDSHPNKDFAGDVVKLLFNRIIDVVENNGSETTLTGKRKNS